MSKKSISAEASSSGAVRTVRRSKGSVEFSNLEPLQGRRKTPDPNFVPPMRIEVDPSESVYAASENLLSPSMARLATKQKAGNFRSASSNGRRAMRQSRPSTGDDNRRSHVREPHSTFRMRSVFNVGERHLAQKNAKHLNVHGPSTFPVFFVGGTVTVRAWATGKESQMEMWYLCLKAFGCLDDEIKEELIDFNEDPQFLEWPSAHELGLRTGAKPGAEIHRLAPGSILEVRSTEWLDNIRMGRERAILEKKLATLSRVKRLAFRIYIFLSEPSSSLSAKVFAIFMMSIIVLSTLTFCLESLPWYFSPHGGEFTVWFFIEATCIVIFTIELTVRLTVCPSKVTFVTEWMNIIDFVAVLPFYLEMLARGVAIPGLAVLRVLRLARVLRLMKVSQGPVKILALTLKESLKPMYSLLMLIAMAMLLFASFIYFAERGALNPITNEWERKTGLRCPLECTEEVLSKTYTEPNTFAPCQEISPGGPLVSIASISDRVNPHARDLAGVPEGLACHPIIEPSPFDSIPISCWWALVTMTTLGYGDMYPVSPAGKLIAVLCMVAGTMVIALPTTVIGQNFSTVYEFTVQRQKRLAEIQKRKRELEKMAEAQPPPPPELEDFRARTFHALASNSIKRRELSGAFSRETSTVGGENEPSAPEWTQSQR